MAEIALGVVGAAATVGAAGLTAGSGFTGRHESSHRQEIMEIRRNTDDFLENLQSGDVTPFEEREFLGTRDEAIRQGDEYHGSIEGYKNISWVNIVAKLSKKKEVRKKKYAIRQLNHSLRSLNESMHSGSDTSSISAESGSPPGSNLAADDIYEWASAIQSKQDAAERWVERAPRKTLNARFLDLAALLPNLKHLWYPSKSAIINSSIAYVCAADRYRQLASQQLCALNAECDMVRREVNQWRVRAGVHPAVAPLRSEGFALVLGGEEPAFDPVDLEDVDDEDADYAVQYRDVITRPDYADAFLQRLKQNTAERRARREILNARFLRPSKSAIVDSSIAHIRAARRYRQLASQQLRALNAECDVVRHEVNQWRARASVHLAVAPPQSEGFALVLSGEEPAFDSVDLEDVDEEPADFFEDDEDVDSVFEVDEDVDSPSRQGYHPSPPHSASPVAASFEPPNPYDGFLSQQQQGDEWAYAYAALTQGQPEW
ncbi:Macrophage erythroblast attacher isoform 1 [Mycena venus]|uniref:Macrophage erythroblast attacher isoform 1 n=1 Tax=Mycena venus TaxID=2733690 RepID=A0A8H7CKY6_9AGAR|nr:Macrophage erythroblast attacher isoform 1 [Mycena venus]